MLKVSWIIALRSLKSRLLLLDGVHDLSVLLLSVSLQGSSLLLCLANLCLSAGVSLGLGLFCLSLSLGNQLLGASISVCELCVELLLSVYELCLGAGISIGQLLLGEAGK